MTDPNYNTENDLCYQNPVFQWLVCVNFDSNTLNGLLFPHLFTDYLWAFLLMNKMLCFPATLFVLTKQSI